MNLKLTFPSHWAHPASWARIRQPNETCGESSWLERRVPAPLQRLWDLCVGDDAELAHEPIQICEVDAGAMRCCNGGYVLPLRLNATPPPEWVQVFEQYHQMLKPLRRRYAKLKGSRLDLMLLAHDEPQWWLNWYGRVVCVVNARYLRQIESNRVREETKGRLQADVACHLTEWQEQARRLRL